VVSGEEESFVGEERLSVEGQVCRGLIGGRFPAIFE
jgi:hypothetical protein